MVLCIPNINTLFNNNHLWVQFQIFLPNTNNFQNYLFNPLIGAQQVLIG